MKKTVLHIFCLVLVLTFSTIGSLSIVCAYHHGIDGPDQRQQSSGHTTLFCSSLSKLSSQVLLISSAISTICCDLASSHSILSDHQSSILLVQNSQARSPPTL